MLSAHSAELLARLAGDDRIEGIAALLGRNGIDELSSAELLTGGKNNKVIRLEPVTGPKRVLKVFFHSADDTRDRLAHEFSFSRFAWDQGLRSLPEPVDAEPRHHCALFEFIAGGRPFYPPRPAMMEEALDFIRGLNADQGAAAHLAPGSEACFSLSQHIAVVDGRIARLRAVDLEEVDRDWIEGKLLPLWSAIRETVVIGSDEPLPLSERIVSPSDFGFHNAIRRDGSDRLCFHDFEYAGWDDPAKLFGDMFNQVEYPLPKDYLGKVAAAFLAMSPRPDDLASRLRLLLPVYGVKWCCIALNPLIAADAARRRFAGHDKELVWQGRQRAGRQWEKARDYHHNKDWLIDV